MMMIRQNSKRILSMRIMPGLQPAARAGAPPAGSRLPWPRLRKSARTPLLAMLAIGGMLLGGCPEDPMGPDNRLALVAFGQCDREQALELTDQVIERGEDEYHVQRAWMLKYAILRDMGRSSAAEAIYPQVEESWQAVRHGKLSASRLERELGILTGIAQNDRHAKGLPPDCAP